VKREHESAHANIIRTRRLVDPDDVGPRRPTVGVVNRVGPGLVNEARAVLGQQSQDLFGFGKGCLFNI
jgi:hypothetical protein